MTREIKFRAWDADNRKMLNADYLIESGLGWVFNNDGFYPMQYTGLKDKNGVEIYEGDILAVKFNHGYVERIYWQGPPDAVCEVYWDYSGFHLKAKGEKDFRYSSFEDLLDEATFSDLLMMNNSESEVIGNVWENPELLK